MKKYFLFLILILLFYGCKDLILPTASELLISKANMVLDGDIQWRYTYFGCPQATGYIKNIGNNTGHNVMIIIICYFDVSKTWIIDIAKGQAVNLAINFGDVIPGQRAFFEATAYNLFSISQIKAYEYKITWLNR